MPRRGNEEVQVIVPKKKLKLADSCQPSLDSSFIADEGLKAGIIFSDINHKRWRIGKPIGRGSFGSIYLASDNVDNEVTKTNARYVVKIEPHSNGPLFVEVHCLIRAAKIEKIKAWRQRNKQKRLGMPMYIASGSYTDENTGVKYRFLVLPRYDIDLQKIIVRTKVLDPKNVLVLAIQILDVLEYLHNQGYTHSDIKASNLMLGYDGSKINKPPLVRSTTSFEKETKELAVLSGRQRKPKARKSRAANYYEDEDFVINDVRSSECEDEEDNDKNLANVKRKLRKILSDRDSRTLHRHHAFNLRQLSNYVNYEDFNSSVCSDRSYQNFLDESKNFESDDQNKDIHKEAVLSQLKGQIYLLDYGLASKFIDNNGRHKEFSMDARKAHDGTLKYSSRDSHIGAHSRRSDLETLGYNILDWITGILPWKKVLSEPDLVHALKKNYMSDIKLFLKTCFKTEFYPQFIEKYLQYVTSLEFTDKPDYDYCRSLFKSELLKNGYDKDICLNFDTPKSPMARKFCNGNRFGRKNTPPDFLSRNGIKKNYERENVFSVENDIKLELLRQTLNASSEGIRKPCASRNFFISDADLVARLKKSLMPHDIFGKKLSPKNLRSNKKKMTKRRSVRKHRNSIGKFGNFMGSARQFTWAEILAGNPEDIIRKDRTAANDEDDDEGCKYRIRKLSNASDSSESNLRSPLMEKDYLKNPTDAMKEVMANFKKKVAGKRDSEVIDGPEGYTPAMIKVLRMKEKREQREKQEAIKDQVKCGKKTTRKTECKTRMSKKKSTSTDSIEKISESEVSPQPIRKSSRQRKKNCSENTGNVVNESKNDKTCRGARKKTCSDSSVLDLSANVSKEEVKITRQTRTMKQTKTSKDSKDKGVEIKDKKAVELNFPEKITRSKVKTEVLKEAKVVIRKLSLRGNAKPTPRSRQSEPVPNRRRLRSSKRKNV